MPNLNVGFFAVVYIAPAIAVTLNYGTQTIRLDSVRRTNPSLAIGLTDGVKYGALYTGNAPTGALHIGDKWVGQNCAPGTYSVDGLSACIDCGLGHYCMGGMHRAACSGGIIACPETRASADAVAPAFANRLLSIDEVNAYVPETSIAQWRMLSCCSDWQSGDVLGDLSLVNTLSGCATKAIGPGTYLFVQNAGAVCGSDDPAYIGYSSFIAIFDHAVSYRSMHAESVFYNFIDIDGPDFTGWDIQVSPKHYCQTAINTNVSDLDIYRYGFALCVYELK